jgi:hypothetical protein
MSVERDFLARHKDDVVTDHTLSDGRGYEIDHDLMLRYIELVEKVDAYLLALGNYDELDSETDKAVGVAENRLREARRRLDE